MRALTFAAALLVTTLGHAAWAQSASEHEGHHPWPVSSGCHGDIVEHRSRPILLPATARAADDIDPIEIRLGIVDVLRTGVGLDMQPSKGRVTNGDVACRPFPYPSGPEGPSRSKRIFSNA
ncbi:hypothetical protein ACVWXO_007399 [Bradyrhizobium sp. LM2.7]